MIPSNQPMGWYLVHDPTPAERERDLDHTVFWSTGSGARRVCITWEGDLVDADTADPLGFHQRHYVCVRISGAQYHALEMAARHHGFHALARRIWKEAHP